MTQQLQDLLVGLSRLSGSALLTADQRGLAAETAGKLAGQSVFVAVVGEFKRGKSSLINTLLGEDLLPTGVIPVTAAPTLVRFGPTARVTARLLEDKLAVVPTGELADYVTELGNPRNWRRVHEVVIEHPSPLLRLGLVLADTPGTGSVHAHNTAATLGFLPRVDVVLLVLSADAPLSAAEADLLGSSADNAALAAVCLNKADLLTPTEQREALGFVRARVGRSGNGDPIPVFMVSARRPDDRRGQGMDALRKFLVRAAQTERDAVVSTRARKVAQSLLNVAESALRLESALAAQPAEQASAARQAFDQARTQLEREAGETVSLLRAAAGQSLATVIAERSGELRSELPRELLASPDQAWEQRSGEAVAGWTRRVGGELSHQIELLGESYGARLQHLIERFILEAGSAFGVELPPPLDMRRQLRIPPIRIRAVDEPGVVAMGLRQVRDRIPGGLGRHWREGARRDLAAAAGDRLAGRLAFAA
ncbi:MAG: dynamin family protein, partial [Candidatus Dormibacteria bacterium]